MTIPGQTIERVDGGLGLGSGDTAARFLLVGTSSTGVVDSLTTWANSSLMRAVLGEGPVVDAAAWIIDNNKMAVDVLKTAAAVSATTSAISKNGGSGPTITVAGAPLNFYDTRLTIGTGGGLGVSTFSYSLDGGQTISDDITIPAGGTYAIPGTGLTLTFPSGTYVAADLYTFSCAPATYSGTNLSDAWETVLASDTKWGMAIWTGNPATAAAAVTLNGTIDGLMEDLEDRFRYSRALVDLGGDIAATTIAAITADESYYYARCYSKVRLELHTRYAGWGKPRLPFVYEMARRCALVKPGTNPAWIGKKDDALKRVFDPEYDDFINGGIMHNARVCAPRTMPGRRIGGHPAVYPTNALTAAPPSSDYRHLQWCRVIDIFSDVVQTEQQDFINSSPRVLADGTGRLDPRDAARMNEQVIQMAETALLKPKMDDGTTGYVSALSYEVDTTNDILTTEELLSSGALVPRANVSQIATTLGFATEIG